MSVCHVCGRSWQQNVVTVRGRKMEIAMAAQFASTMLNTEIFYTRDGDRNPTVFLAGWFAAKNMGYLPNHEDVEEFMRMLKR